MPQLGDSTTKQHHFTLEPEGIEIENVDRHDFRCGLTEPTSRCGRRHSVPSRKLNITCRLHEIAKTMVVGTLHASYCGHAWIFACRVILRKRSRPHRSRGVANSRRKLQNVVRDSMPPKVGGPLHKGSVEFLTARPRVQQNRHHPHET
ncbi:MAG: hypothetical protein CMJ64_23210 [Planctomycetaceae bacterium]|nr:hypothetical protein [Planctomycetaceae bacterium]